MSGNQLKISVGVAGEDSRKSRIAPLLTLERVVQWIKSHNFDQKTEEGLIELAANYPNAALPSFRRNFNVMLNRVRVKNSLEINRQITDPKTKLEKVDLKAPVEPVVKKEVKNNVAEVKKPSLREMSRQSNKKEEESREVQESFELDDSQSITFDNFDSFENAFNDPNFG